MAWVKRLFVSRERREKQPVNVRDEMYRAIAFMLLSTVILLIIGVMMVYSATAPSGLRDAILADGGNPFAIANMQLIYAVIGVVMAVVAAFLPMNFYRRMAPVLFLLGLGLQALVRSPLGRNIGGNTNWVRLGPIQLQPSEFLKLASIVFLAAALSRVVPETARWRDWLLPAGGGAIVGTFAILLGGDMGTALTYVVIAVAIFWLAGLPGLYFAVFGGVAAVAAGVLVASASTRIQRVSEFFANLLSLPDEKDPTQLDFALWAFGSGGIGGSGIGTGVEKWPGNMPAAQTDFIFAVIGEELGLGGSILVVGLFMLLGWSLMQICRYHPDRFARYIAGGVAAWLTGQALVNMMVVTGLLPVFGVPLPFISQGGTSLMACLLTIGVVMSCTLAVPDVKDSFRVRRGLAYRARALVRKGQND